MTTVRWHLLYYLKKEKENKEKRMSTAQQIIIWVLIASEINTI